MKHAGRRSSALNLPNVAGYFPVATVLFLAILALAGCDGRAKGAHTAEPGNDRPHTPARAQESAAVWASRLARNYDGRGALTINNSRDPKSTADAMIAWSAAAEGRTEKADALNLMLFVNQYSPIWNGSNVDKAVLAKLMGRLKLVERGQIESWRTALRSVHGDDISEQWAAGILITIDPVFPESGLDAKQSEALRARLFTLPPAAVASLATKLKTAKAVVAGKMIQQNALFSGSSFNQKYFDDSLKALDGVIAKK